MSARDELFQLILGRTTTKAVERILAAGYTRPRTIETVEELDALGWMSTILDANLTVWISDGEPEDPWASVAESSLGGPVWTSSPHIALPATVLYDPTPTAHQEGTR